MTPGSLGEVNYPGGEGQLFERGVRRDEEEKKSFFFSFFGQFCHRIIS